jgi:hypothetical protein
VLYLLLKEQLVAAECQGFVLERPRLISPTQQRFDETGAMLREAQLRELHRDQRESEIASGAPIEVDDYDELMGPDPALVRLFESIGRPDELLIAAQNLVGVRFVDEDHTEWRILFGKGSHGPTNPYDFPGAHRSGAPRRCQSPFSRPHHPAVAHPMPAAYCGERHGAGQYRSPCY